MFKAPVRETCGQCHQVVYPTEKMVLEGMVIHKTCFTCKHCKRTLTVSNFAAVRHMCLFEDPLSDFMSRVLRKISYFELFRLE